MIATRVASQEPNIQTAVEMTSRKDEPPDVNS